MHFTYNIPPNLARALPKGTVSSFVLFSLLYFAPLEKETNITGQKKDIYQSDQNFGKRVT